MQAVTRPNEYAKEYKREKPDGHLPCAAREGIKNLSLRFEIITQPTWNRKARKAFEVVGKNAGEFIGGNTMGTISFWLAAETGYLAPMSPYVGYSGYIYGSYRGGKEGEYYAGRLFDSMYSVYLVDRKLKKISDQSILYQQMYNNNPSPYPF